MDTQIIENQSFGGERALYHRHGLELRNCTFNEGESCLKEGTNINTHNCTFIGKYALWHNHIVVLLCGMTRILPCVIALVDHLKSYVK